MKVTNVFESKKIGLPKPNYEYITTDEGARNALTFLDRYPIYSIDTDFGLYFCCI